MGSYLFSDAIFDKFSDKVADSEYEDLTNGIKKYISIEGKQIDEILQAMENVYDGMDDGIGAVTRAMRQTSGKIKLSENFENTYAEGAYVLLLIRRIKELKVWMEENPSR